MAYVTSNRSTWSIAEVASRLMQNVQQAAQRRRIYVQTLTELRALTDRDLADLGMHASQIEVVARVAAYGK